MNRPILKKLPALLAILFVAGVVQAFTSCSSDDGGSPTGPQYNEKSSSSWAQTEISSSSNQTFVEPSSSSAGGQNPNPVPSSSSVGQNIPSSSSVTPTTGLKQFGTAKVCAPASNCIAGSGSQYDLGTYPAYNESGSPFFRPDEIGSVGPLGPQAGIREGRTFIVRAGYKGGAHCGGLRVGDAEESEVALIFDDPCPEQEQ